MARERKPSLEMLKVLAFFLEDKDTSHYGLELAQATHLSAGSLYPILFRLEQRGWIEGEWEDIDQSEVGRKRRRYYTLTPQGANAARNLSDTNPRPLPAPTGVRR